MYLELCHVSAARSLEQILFSKIHLFFTGKVIHNFENIILYIPKSDVVLVTQLISASNASLLSFYVTLLQFPRTMRTGLHTCLKMMDNSKDFVCEVEVFNDN